MDFLIDSHLVLRSCIYLCWNGSKRRRKIKKNLDFLFPGKVFDYAIRYVVSHGFLRQLFLGEKEMVPRVGIDLRILFFRIIIIGNEKIYMTKKIIFCRRCKVRMSNKYQLHKRKKKRINSVTNWILNGIMIAVVLVFHPLVYMEPVMCVWKYLKKFFGI